MNIEKSLRAFIGSAYDSPELIVPTDEEAVEMAQLSTDNRNGQEVMPIFEDEYWPKSLHLRVRLKPVSFQSEQNQIMATFVSNETAFVSTLFYARDHQEGQLLNKCYAGVDLVYGGVGSYVQNDSAQVFAGSQFNTFTLKFLSDKSGLIYHKAFAVQRVPSVMCSQRHMGAGKWSITTHAQQQLQINEVPIFAYGGIYQPHLSLDSVVPIYATVLGSQDCKTLVSLKSQTFWHDKGVFENQSVQLGDTIYTFHDLLHKEQTLSLATIILSGFVKISMESEGDYKVYQSRRYQTLLDGQGLIEITFVPTD